jgi:hypothetical protein
LNDFSEPPMLSSSIRPVSMLALAVAAAAGAWFASTTRVAEAQVPQPGQPMQMPVPWQQQISNALPIFGEGNWVIVADTSFPLLAKPGIETIRVPDDLAGAVNSMEGIFQMNERLRPSFHLCSELDFVAKQDESVRAYLDKLEEILPAEGVVRISRQKLIDTVIETAEDRRVLVIKTDSMVPYGTVAMRLAPGFWTAEQEATLREAMKAAGAGG